MGSVSFLNYNLYDIYVYLFMFLIRYVCKLYIEKIVYLKFFKKVIYEILGKWYIVIIVDVV